MQILNLGGATAMISHKGKRILFDPWLDEGIMHGSWYHFPPIDKSIGMHTIRDVDYVYISHIHEDHCSYKTIREINRDAEIIIMDREPKVRNFVLHFLKSRDLHFKKVHLLRPLQPTQVGDMTIEMLEADPAHEYNYQVDSACVISWDGFKIYNANDCAPTAANMQHINNSYGRLDLALLPYAGSSGYPGCYTNLSDAQKLGERDRIRDSGYKLFFECVRTLNPKVAMPFADQFVIGGSRSALNKYSAHPNGPADILERPEYKSLDVPVLCLNSGQSYDLTTGAKSPNDPPKVWTESDKKAYIESISTTAAYDHEIFPLSESVPVPRLLKQARQNLWMAQQRAGLFPDMRLYIDLTDSKRRFAIDLKNQFEETAATDSPLQEPYLRMSMSTSLFILLLIRHVSWNIADGALFIDYDRTPNVYYPEVYSLINHLAL